VLLPDQWEEGRRTRRIGGRHGSLCGRRCDGCETPERLRLVERERPPSFDRVERAYLDVAARGAWSVPVVSSAQPWTTPQRQSGVKMNPLRVRADHRMVWDKDKGGAFGFARRSAPGGPPHPADRRLKEFIPRSTWGRATTLALPRRRPGVKERRPLQPGHGAALRQGEGTSATTIWKGGGHGLRGRGARCSRRTAATSRSTGVFQWMLNNAWPSISWHLYDYTLRPGPVLGKPDGPASRWQLQYRTTTVRRGGDEADAFAGLRSRTPSTTSIGRRSSRRTETVTVRIRASRAF